MSESVEHLASEIFGSGHVLRRGEYISIQTVHLSGWEVREFERRAKTRLAGAEQITRNRFLLSFLEPEP